MWESLILGGMSLGDGMKEKNNYMDSFFHHAVSIVAKANMAKTEECLKGTKEIEEIAETGYYDDEEGAELLRSIAKYIRNKIK